jgi:hypothetical protein
MYRRPARDILAPPAGLKAQNSLAQANGLGKQLPHYSSPEGGCSEMSYKMLEMNNLRAIKRSFSFWADR